MHDEPEVPAGGDEVLYELDEWEPHEREALSEALTDARIEHRWDVATLVIAAHDEPRVERIFDQVDEQLDLELEPELDKVAYDLSAWDDLRRGSLVEALAEHAIPHAWAGDELFVHEEDEQAVDDLVDRVDKGEPAVLPEEAGTGADLLGAIFVAADRLMHDPKDDGGTLDLMDTARLALESPPPFGFDQAAWDTILDQVQALVLLVGEELVDEDAVIDRATTLRATLRPLV